jgi:hypothetical protein
MRRLLGSRLSVAVVASVVTAVVVGGVAWAVQSPVDGNGVIHACYNPTTGAVQLDVVGSCPKKGNTTPITWNVQGPRGDPGTNGSNGQSVTATVLAVADPNCPFGGSQFTAANGTTYACNGADGQPGAPGPAGPTNVAILKVYAHGYAGTGDDVSGSHIGACATDSTSSPCFGVYPLGYVVTLMSSAPDVSWAGDCAGQTGAQCTLTMDGDKTVDATDMSLPTTTTTTTPQTIGVPDAPTNVVATPEPGAAMLTWTAPNDNGASITQYVISTYVDGNLQAQQTAYTTASSMMISSLTAGTQYTFKVAARNSYGIGPQSAPSNVMTPT